MKILIMAGGKGTRLWPLSSQEKPKQFQKIISDRTMLQETVSRILPIAKWDDIYISTHEKYFSEIIKELPRIKRKNIITEPANRERASSIALSCAIITKRHPGEIIVAMPADHLIKRKGKLISVISKAQKILNKFPDHLIAIGIPPRFADTGLGYIQQGEPINKISKKVLRVKRFVEKPEAERAKKFIKTKKYFWNSGIYIFKPEILLELFKKYVPDTFQHISKISQKIDTKNYKEILKKEYPETDIISFEYSIVENYNKILFIPADLGWSDIGSWAALKDSLVKHNHKNLIKATHLDIDSRDILVYGPIKKNICTIGLKELVIVDTQGALLICDKSCSQKVREIVKMLENSKKR